jgi:hypothetical protein
MHLSRMPQSRTAKLDRMPEMDKKIMALCSAGKTQQAALAGISLLGLYDELKVSDLCYIRTHFDLFQMYITQRNTVGQGIDHIKKAYQHALLFYGYEGHEDVQKYGEYTQNPEKHRNYCMLD